MKRLPWILILIICLAAVPSFAEKSIADSVKKYIEMGDKLSDKWDHAGAANKYLHVLKFDPKNYEALWKAGDAYTEIADKESAKFKKESMFIQAKTLCEKAIAVNPDGWEGHFRLSVALGRLALFRGGKEKINLSKRIKAEADTALVLNPEAHLAMHVLGRWHQNLANLSSMLKFFAKVLYGGVPPGSNEEAVAFFKKAIEIDPNHIEHHLELARTYKFMGEKELMIEPLEKVLSMPAKEQDDKKFKKEAESMLKKIKKKKK